MKYYLIAGEASGDLHASRLMQELKRQDADAEFRFYGGDQMQAVGGTMVKHYRELAYMGFIPVLLHLPTILRNMRQAKHDIRDWQPDAVILVDYPGFNLSIAKFAKELQLSTLNSQLSTPKSPRVYYYIAPKIWAWKEYRIKNIKRDVDELFSILPFEVEFFEKKHHYPIHYVGNPTAEEVRQNEELRMKNEVIGKPLVTEGTQEFATASEPRAVANSQLSTLKTKIPTLNSQLSTLKSSLKTIALLCGSRRQEIKDNLPAMLRVTDKYADRYQVVIAGAPGIAPDYYRQFMEGHHVEIVFNQTYDLLSCAHAALVTSGTATLETALFRVPQVVCYETPMHWLYAWLRRKLLKVKYVSLVNLIADREVVRELVADTFSEENIECELKVLLPPDSPQRLAMLKGYDEVARRLGTERAPENAARIMVRLLNGVPA